MNDRIDGDMSKLRTILKNAHSSVGEIENKILEMGISSDAIDKFNLGSLSENEVPYLSIPVGSEGAFLYCMSESHIEYRGKWDVFNGSVLQKEDPTFICGSCIDAMILSDLGYNAVSFSVNDTQKFINKYGGNLKNKVLICADNTYSSDDYSEKLSDKLRKSSIKSNPRIYEFPNVNYDNITDWFRDNQDDLKDDLKLTVESITNETRTDYARMYLSSKTDSVVEWLIGGNADYIPTGYSNLDKILDGGLPIGLTILASESSMGKSTLAMNIAENIAHSGRDVLYFSLEMSNTQTVLRGLARTIHEISPNNALTVPEIKNKKEINPAYIRDYKSNYAQKMVVYTIDDGCSTIDSIEQAIEKHIKLTENKPVVFIDYLQYIRGDLKLSDKQNADEHVRRIKDLAIHYDLCIVAISSLNRDSYGGRVKMSSLKESGGIEYTADCILGLNPSYIQYGQKGSETDLREFKMLSPRHMSIEILKSRDSEVGRITNLDYYAQYFHYVDSKREGAVYDPIKEEE